MGSPDSVAGVFHGQILIALVTILSFLALMYGSANSENAAEVRKEEEEVGELSSYDSIHASQAKKTLDQQQQPNNSIA